jgi:two-component system sensor histidine kinase EvgS
MKRFIGLLLVAVLTGCSISDYSSVDETKIPLTEQELAYISAHPSVTWAVEDNRPPYVFVEGGDIKGLSYDYLKLISKKTGLKFEPLDLKTFFYSIEALRVGKVDLMSALRPTRERAEFMAFTPPIAYNGGMFLFRVNTLPRSPLTVGIRKGEAAKEYLVTRFPDMKIVETEDDEEALALLQKGLLDGAVMDEGTADYLIKRGNLQARKANVNFDYPYSFAYSKDNHLLGSIMTKAVSSITPADKQKLNNKWMKEKK